MGRHKTVFGTAGMLRPFPLTYTGLISALLAASVILLGHVQLRHIRNVRKQRVKLSAIVESIVEGMQKHHTNKSIIYLLNNKEG